MAGELTIPILPCRDVDETTTFYEALGFARTYRQLHPNPYVVVAREDMQIHLFGLEEFDPETSTGNVIVAVPDPDELYESFAAGLRDTFGKLPSAGIPRILRPRKRFGTVRGFSVVDPGGNWLRFSKLGDTEDEAKKTQGTGLTRVIENAARQGDARGSDPDALDVLNRGIERFPDAPAVERARALLYRAEIAVRLGDSALATSSLTDARSITLSDTERREVEADFEHATEIVDGIG